MSTIPYTYLIGWSTINAWYYGVRYAKKCHPSDFWTTYYTSSGNVVKLINEYGNPDIIQIRKTFDSVNAARKWEHKVLRRLGCVNDPKFINKTDNISFVPKPGVKRPGIGGVKFGTPSPIKGKFACHNPDTGKIKYCRSTEEIPNGFIKGGPPKSKSHNEKNSKANKGRQKHSRYQKEKWSETRKNKNLYGENYNAKPVIVDGVKYFSKKEAREKTKLNKPNLEFYLKYGYHKPKTKKCKWCGKTVSNGNYTRWHGDNCNQSL